MHTGSKILMQRTTLVVEVSFCRNNWFNTSVRIKSQLHYTLHVSNHVNMSLFAVLFGQTIWTIFIGIATISSILVCLLVCSSVFFTLAAKLALISLSNITTTYMEVKITQFINRSTITMVFINQV